MKFLFLFSCIFFIKILFSQTESENSEKNLTIESPKMMEVLISPNPAIDKCIVIGEKGATCTLYSSSGTYIGKWIFDDSNSVLLTDLPIGVLQAIIEKNGVIVIKRIVVI